MAWGPPPCPLLTPTSSRPWRQQGPAPGPLAGLQGRPPPSWPQALLLSTALKAPLHTTRPLPLSLSHMCLSASSLTPARMGGAHTSQWLRRLSGSGLVSNSVFESGSTVTFVLDARVVLPCSCRFHAACDGTGPTVVVLRDAAGQVGGGGNPGESKESKGKMLR